MIGVKYMGYVTKVYVDIGDRVKQEDILYEIESSEFDLIRMQSELMIDQAEVVAKYWKNRANRLDEKKKLIQKHKNKDFEFSFNDLDDQSDNAIAMLKEAKIAIKNATKRLNEIMSVYNHLKMKAPSDGIILQRNIKVGDMLMPGMLAILMLDTQNLYIDISIAESLLKYFYVGKIAKIKLRSLDKILTGKVKAIIPSSNFVTHKIKVRIDINEDHPRILEGMYSEVFLDIPMNNDKK